MAHIEGTSRYQRSLVSASLDERVPADDPVRVIDAFVAGLALGSLGFGKVAAAATGRPPYRPADLLKLYVYGYLNHVRSSRRLAREARRNVEVRWLIDAVTPSFKTIADFRRDHPRAIGAVCAAFVRFCREQKLFGGDLLALDGTKIEAVASRKQVLTPKELAKQLEGLDRRIATYLAEMDRIDRQEAAAGDDAPEARSVRLALAALQARRVIVEVQAAALDEQGLSQVVQGEPDARLMRTARHGMQVAYNAQSIVDAKHGLIAAVDLSGAGNDRNQLAAMAKAGKEATGAEAPTVVADAGYANGEQARQCTDAGITPVVPRPRTPNPKNTDLYSRDAFTYDPATDSWTCPAGQTLTPRDHAPDRERTRYMTSACAGCRLRPDCTRAKSGRTIVRSMFEDDRQAMHQRALDDPSLLRRRQTLAEQPFALIKWMMGVPRFLLRGVEKARAELNLVALAFNIRRTIAVMGTAKLCQALQAGP